MDNQIMVKYLAVMFSSVFLVFAFMCWSLVQNLSVYSDSGINYAQGNGSYIQNI